RRQGRAEASVSQQVDIARCAAEDDSGRADRRAIDESDRLDDALSGSIERDGLRTLNDVDAALDRGLPQSVDNRLPPAVQIQYRSAEGQLQLLDRGARALALGIVGE